VLLHDDIQTAVNDLEILINDFINPYLGDLTNIATNINNYFPNNPTLATAVQNYLNSIVAATNTFLGVAVHDWATCANGLLNYFAGLFCFACEPVWQSYVTQVNGGYVVSFSTETCTELSGKCVAFFEDIVTYHVAIANAVNTLITAVGTDTTGSAVPQLEVQFHDCNGQCDTYICYHFVLGLGYTSAFSGSVETGSESTGTNRRSVPIGSAIAVLNQIETEKRGNLGDLTATYFQKLSEGLERVTSVTKKINSLRVPHELRTTTVNNQYNSTGYPVYDNGQNSGLDTSVNSGVSLFNWINYFF